MHFKFVPLLLAPLLFAIMTFPAHDARAEKAGNGDTGTDPYLWLEDVDGPDATAWADAQSKKTADALTADPRFEAAREAIASVMAAKDRIPEGVFEDGHVYNFWQDAGHVRGVLRRSSAKSYLRGAPEWETVLDIDALAAAEHTPWVFKDKNRICLAPAHRFCLIGLSNGGKDAVTWREFDMREKRFVDGGIVIPEAKSNVVWLDRDTLLLSTDFGPGSLTASGYPRFVKRWTRGTALAAAPTLLEAATDDMMASPLLFEDGADRHFFLQRIPSFFEEDIYALTPNGGKIRLPLPLEVESKGVWKGLYLVQLRKDFETFKAGSLIGLDLAALLNRKETRVSLLYAPPPKASINAVERTRDHLVLSVLENVSSKLILLRQGGNGFIAETADPGALSSADILSADGKGDIVLLKVSSFLDPETLAALNAASGKMTKIMALPPRFDASSLAAEQRFAISKDGTRIPYFLVHDKDMPANGKTPTLLWGYGGFEISVLPAYLNPLAQQWVKSGGAFAVANIRGGGEFGPSWHQAALKENRQRAYDDFIAVAEHLIETGVTAPSRLGIWGGSNGGLLMGVMTTERPDLFNAVLCDVPLLDMLRYNKLLAGASWMGEYGNPDDSDDRAYIEDYSPYQNIDAGTRYPEVFFFTNRKDDRVHPGHARKMAAKMTDMGKPVLFYENAEGGHMRAANPLARAKIYAMQLVYLWRHLKD